MLGICYGMQLIAHHLGGKVDPGQAREYGPALLAVQEPNGLFKGLSLELPVWMSHGDHVSELPPGFHSLASSGNSPVAAFTDGRGIFGIQFHPEVVHTPSGREVLRNFLYGGVQVRRVVDGRLVHRRGDREHSSPGGLTAVSFAGCRAASIPRWRRRSCIAPSGTS